MCFSETLWESSTKDRFLIDSLNMRINPSTFLRSTKGEFVIEKFNIETHEKRFSFLSSMSQDGEWVKRNDAEEINTECFIFFKIPSSYQMELL